MKALRGLQYAAASITIVTGVLQLIQSGTLRTIEKGDPTLQAFFIGIGVLQLFWAVGIIRKWGNQFYSLANGITIALIFLRVLLRLPKPIIGATLPTDSLSIAIQALQIMFFALCTTILATKTEDKRSTAIPTTVPELKTNITNNIPTSPRSTSMAGRRVVVLGIGAAVIIIGLIGVTYTMSEVVQIYEIKKTSTPPYTSEPSLPVESPVYVEIAFIIILIAGLFIASYGATLGARPTRPEIGR